MEFLALSLYVLQQLGVTLGTGAITFYLIFSILSDEDGVLDASEERFMSAVKTTIFLGLVLIIVSGFAITTAHLLVDEAFIVFSAPYLFKWILLLILICAAFARRFELLSKDVEANVAGSTWFALFFLHTTAPLLPWGILIACYTVWVLLFTAGFVFMRSALHASYERERYGVERKN